MNRQEIEQVVQETLSREPAAPPPLDSSTSTPHYVLGGLVLLGALAADTYVLLKPPPGTPVAVSPSTTPSPRPSHRAPGTPTPPTPPPPARTLSDDFGTAETLADIASDAVTVLGFLA